MHCNEYLVIFFTFCFLGIYSVPLNLSNKNNKKNDISSSEALQYGNLKKKMILSNPSDEELLQSQATLSELKSAIDPGHVGFYFYSKESPSTAVRLFLNDTDGLKKAGYNPKSKTKIIVHGFLDNLGSDMVQNMKNNFLNITYEDINVIAVDWSYYTVIYVNVYQKAFDLGALMGSFIGFLVREGTSLEDIHCIGHSLGAHACGFAGSNVDNGLIGRITGLDPAQPGFDISNASARLNANQARFVDCIHTCAGTLGIIEPICSADFYPNAGANQPGCHWYDFVVCSHGRSHELFAESILQGHLFPSLSCESLKFLPEECTLHGALMGYPATNKYLGILYTITGDHYPYALNWTHVDFTETKNQLQSVNLGK